MQLPLDQWFGTSRQACCSSWVSAAPTNRVDRNLLGRGASQSTRAQARVLLNFDRTIPGRGCDRPSPLSVDFDSHILKVSRLRDIALLRPVAFFNCVLAHKLSGSRPGVVRMTPTRKQENHIRCGNDFVHCSGRRSTLCGTLRQCVRPGRRTRPGCSRPDARRGHPGSGHRVP